MYRDRMRFSLCKFGGQTSELKQSHEVLLKLFIRKVVIHTENSAVRYSFYGVI